MKRFNNFLYMHINDLYIDFKFVKNEKRINIPINIVKDGKILDFNQLFYIINKFLKDNLIKNNCKTFIVLESSKIINYEMKSPILNDNDIESMIYYDALEKFDLDINSYRIIFKKEKHENKLNLDISLIPLEIISSYNKLANSLSLNLINIQSILGNEIFKEYENLLVMNITNTIISIKSDKKKIKKIVFDQEFYALIEKFNVEYEDICYIIKKSKDNIKVNYDIEILSSKINILIRKRILFLKSYISNLDKSIFVLNNLDSDLDFTLYKNSLDFEFTILNNLQYKFNTENLNVKNKENNKKIIVSLAIILILLVNIFIYLDYNNKVALKEDELKKSKIMLLDLENQIKKLNSKESKLKNETLELEKKELIKKNNLLENNKKFIDLIIKLEQEKQNELLLTDYEFKENIIFISGICNSETELDNFLKDLKYESKLINSYVEDDVLKFKLKIDLGDK